MAQYRQVKLRQLGLHEDLQTSIERYKQLHRLGPDLDLLLAQEDETKVNQPLSGR